MVKTPNKPKRLKPEPEPFDARKSDGMLLLDAIKSDLPDVDFFTREDLLHLSVFDHVATITRYGKVRIAVHYLLDHDLLSDYGRVALLKRSELCLPERAKFITGTHALENRFSKTVFDLVVKRPARQQFAIMDLVTDWTTDQHLTLNSKRVLVRSILRRMVREGVIHDAGDYLYSTGA